MKFSILKKVLPVVFLLVLGFILLLYLSFATIAPVLYPKRVDSSYVHLNNQELLTQTYNDTVIDPVQLLYHPSQMNVSVKDISCVSVNGVTLNGWFYDKPRSPSGTAIMAIHNLGDSKISLMESCRLFNELGFYVFCFDLPAHGTSPVEIFSPSEQTMEALRLAVDSIYCYHQVENLVIIGSGFNTILAAKLAIDVKAKVLILEDPVSSAGSYLRSITDNRWGSFSPLIYPFACRLYEYKSQVNMDSLILSSIIKTTGVPLMVTVTAISVLKNEVGDAVTVYKESASPVKKIWTDKARGFITNTNDGEKNYYRALAAFINSNIPQKTTTKRKRKSLVERDHQIHHRQNN